MQCDKCGTEVQGSSKFCGQCGAPVGAEPAGAPSAAPPAGAPPVQPAPAAASQAEERILWEEHPSLLTVAPPLIALLAVTIIAGAAGWAIAAKAGVAALKPVTVGLAVWGVGALLIAGLLVKHLIRLLSLRYRLSTQRIFIEHGLLNKRTDEVELEHYKDVFVKQDFWDRLVGCGDVSIVTGDITSPTIDIVDVRDPVSKKETIRTTARDRQIALGIMRREEL